MKKYVVGVDLGGTKVYTALVDEDGKIKKEIELKTEAHKGTERVVDNIFITIEAVIAEVSRDDILAIGIGTPGLLDIQKGTIIEATNLPFVNYNLINAIESKFGIKTFLDNDGNVATIGEYIFGAGRGTKNMLYVTASTGIGAGVIINGEIYRGHTSNAVEIGHITLLKGGPRCRCGNLGCAEALASGTAIVNRAKDAIASNADTKLKIYKDITAKDVFKEAEAGDFVAKQIQDQALQYLGITIANVVMIFDPEKIIIGGGIVKAGEKVFEAIYNEVKSISFKKLASFNQIVEAELGGRSGILGAAALALNESRKMNITE